MRKWALLAVLFIGILLFWGEGGIPVFGDPSAPANQYVSNQYLEDTLEDTATVNVVTAILADYRGYDTLGETTVIFTAGIAVLLLLRREGKL